MHYSYGDSSKSPFTSNFLELLRDAIDFAVYAIEADQRIVAAKERGETLRRAAEKELEQLDVLKAAVVRTIETTAKGAADSPAMECATRLTVACDETVRASAASVNKKLAQSLAQSEAEEAAEREACMATLLTLLVPHVPPDGAMVSKLHWREAGGYAAVLKGTWPSVGLKWKCASDAPTGQAFDQPLSVDGLMHGLEIGAPEASGWIRKELKIRPQNLGRHVLTDAAVQDTTVKLSLRSEPASTTGFDFEAELHAGTVKASRVIEGDGAMAAGAFELDAADVPKIIELCKIVRAQLGKFKPSRISSAELGESRLETLPRFLQIAEALIDYLTPLVTEVARHSLEPDELVLRRPLGDDRREEIFVSKATLREKYDRLPAEPRALFLKLGLHGSLSRSMPPAAGTRSDLTRSELPQSNPPPPPVIPVLPLPPPPSAQRPAIPPAAMPDPSTSTAATDKVTDKAPLAVELKKILELGKAGRLDDAFSACAAVLDAAGFADHSPTEQRQALRLLFVLDKPGAPSDVVRRAQRAGRRRASEMVTRLGEPADYELLGLCQGALDESAAAAQSFKKGLELERSRNPNSDLCARLATHVS